MEPRHAWRGVNMYFYTVVREMVSLIFPACRLGVDDYDGEYRRALCEEVKMRWIVCLLALYAVTLALPVNARPAQGVRLQVVNPPLLVPEQEVLLTFALTDSRTGKPLPPEALSIMHEQKFHLLGVDASLTDYQHLHPTPGTVEGQYVTRFTPHKPGDYRVWANVMPVSQKGEAYAVADIKGSTQPETINPVLNTSVEVEGLVFTLSFDTVPQAGDMAMGRVIVKQNGLSFTQLEPVMGAFAHVVAFPANRLNVLHVHPLGEEPTDKDARGGPLLEFHFMPQEPGFAKLFVQVRVKGQDIFAPFGVMVR